MPRPKEGYDLLNIYLEPALRLRLKHAALDAGCSLSTFISQRLAASLGEVVPAVRAERPLLVVPSATATQPSHEPRNCLECGVKFAPPPKGARAVYCGDGCRKKAYRDRRKSA